MKNQEKQKKIIIVGAGISGITSGIYGQKNGFITEIYERNPSPGGLCMSWVRSNHPIDGCIHWMTGTKKGTALYNMWQDVEAFSDEDIIREDNFGSVEIDGVKVVFWNDLNKLEKHLIEIAPEDKKRIKKMCNLIFLFQNMPLPVDIPVNTMNIKDFLKIAFGMIPYLFSYLITKHISIKSYCLKFKNPILKKALRKLIGDQYSLYSALYVFGTTALGNGGVPKDGSTGLINKMVNQYENLGGKIHTCSDVKEIIIKDKKAVGIRLKNGEEKFADYIIAACDPFHVKQLLNNQYSLSKYEKLSTKSNIYPLPSCVFVSCLVDLEEKRKLNLTSTYEWFCDEFVVGNSIQNSLKIRDYSYDPHFIKNGKVLLSTMIPQYDDDYLFWDALKNRDEYLNEKRRIGDLVLSKITKKFPTLKGKIEVVDIATPKTFNRYTNAFRGAYMPFALTAKNSMLLHNGKVKGVKNLLLSSQWQIMPGGLPVALMTGKFSIQRILKKEHRFYRITKPVKFSYCK